MMSSLENTIQISNSLKSSENFYTKKSSQTPTELPIDDEATTTSTSSSGEEMSTISDILTSEKIQHVQSTKFSISNETSVSLDSNELESASVLSSNETSLTKKYAINSISRHNVI